MRLLFALFIASLSSLVWADDTPALKGRAKYALTLFDSVEEAQLAAEWLAVNEALERISGAEAFKQKMSVSPEQWKIVLHSLPYQNLGGHSELVRCDESADVGMCYTAQIELRLLDKGYALDYLKEAVVRQADLMAAVDYQKERLAIKLNSGWPLISATVSAVTEASRYFIRKGDLSREYYLALMTKTNNAVYASAATRNEAQARADRVKVAMHSLASAAKVSTNTTIEEDAAYGSQVIYSAKVELALRPFMRNVKRALIGGAETVKSLSHQCGTLNQQALSSVALGASIAVERYGSTHGGYQPSATDSGVSSLHSLGWFSANSQYWGAEPPEGVSPNIYRFGLCDLGRSREVPNMPEFYRWHSGPAWTKTGELRCHPNKSPIDCAAYGAAWLLDRYEVRVTMQVGERQKHCKLVFSEDLRHLPEYEFYNAPLSDDSPSEIRMPSLQGWSYRECRMVVPVSYDLRGNAELASSLRVLVEVVSKDNS